MIHRHRRFGATAIAAGCALCIAACGSSSGSGATSSNAAAGRARPAGLTLTTTQRSCLKTHGVTLPAAGAGRGGPMGRGTGHGRTGTPPKGAQAPAGGRHAFKGGRPGAGGFGGADHAKMQKALKACGVSFGHGSAGGAPSSGTTTTGG